eukprot:27464-Eustigmatos_ZCMA.PRE.1
MLQTKTVVKKKLQELMRRKQKVGDTHNRQIVRWRLRPTAALAMGSALTCVFSLPCAGEGGQGCEERRIVRQGGERG